MPSRFGVFICDTWFLEGLALFLSAGSLVATVVILGIFNNSPLPHLPSSLTLNTILAILAATSKSSLIFAVSAAVGQCNWCWFRSKCDKRKCLIDLQGIDDACRGPLGSARVLCTPIASSLCSLGATVILLGIAYEPFIQQLVRYPPRLTNDTSGIHPTISQAIAISPFSLWKEWATAGVYTNIYPDRPLYCPTGNCTWSPFWSVGWCSKCEDAPLKSQDCDFSFRDLADRGENLTRQCHFSPPDGETLLVNVDFTVITSPSYHSSLQLNYTSTWFLSAASSEIAHLVQQSTENYTVIQGMHSLLRLGYTHFDITNPSQEDSITHGWSSRSCTLTPCSRKYSAAVLDGREDVKILEEDYGLIYFNRSLDSWYSICWRPTLGDQNTSLELSNILEYDLFRDKKTGAFCSLPIDIIGTLAGLFAGHVLVEINSDSLNIIDGGISESQGADMNQTMSNIYFKLAGLPNILPQIANALTYYNLHSDDILGNAHLNTLHGTAQIQKTFVSVRWPWIILPATLNILGLIFLLLTALYTHKHNIPLWKTSIFALLYHGLEDKALNSTSQAPYNRASEMEDRARNTYVRLRGLSEVDEEEQEQEGTEDDDDDDDHGRGRGYLLLRT